MFLRAVCQRNAGLVQFAAQLHTTGAIPPNTYVIDRGAVGRNAARLARRAAELNLGLYFMGKQLDYDTELTRVIQQSIPTSVAVDWMGAEALLALGVRLGHVGHLVPVPRRTMPRLLAGGPPEVWTLLDEGSARLLSAATRAMEMKREQAVLLRAVGPSDLQMVGQEGGFPLDEVVSAAQRIARLPGLRIAGVTSYPCFAWDDTANAFQATPNFETLLTAAARLRAAGFNITQVNAPGHTSLSLLPVLAEHGATQGEPGHALSGTTPEGATGRSEEEPAVVYVTEVSGVLPSGNGLAYGGGLYPRGRARAALVGTTVNEVLDQKSVPVTFPAPGNIDYQCSLEVPSGRHIATGDTVVMAFRFQLFVLRSYRAIVDQDASGRWHLAAFHSPHEPGQEAVNRSGEQT